MNENAEEKLKKYVCNKLCRFPLEATNEHELDIHCSKCSLKKLVMDVIREN